MKPLNNASPADIKRMKSRQTGRLAQRVGAEAEARFAQILDSNAPHIVRYWHRPAPRPIFKEDGRYLLAPTGLDFVWIDDKGDVYAVEIKSHDGTSLGIRKGRASITPTEMRFILSPKGKWVTHTGALWFCGPVLHVFSAKIIARVMTSPGGRCLKPDDADISLFPYTTPEEKLLIAIQHFLKED